MERKLYTPTEKQDQKWAILSPMEMPTDEWFMDRWAKDHHGKVAGWGMGKRDFVVSNMKNTREYQMGIWQGRLDKARGMEYAEERSENVYNLGYYRGYTEWKNGNDRNGMDAATYERFMQQVNS